MRPDVWERGIGSRLWEACLPVVDGWGVTETGLFTFAESPKHAHLYRKHGFWPRFLTTLTDKPVVDSGAPVETVAQKTAEIENSSISTSKEVAKAEVATPLVQAAAEAPVKAKPAKVAAAPAEEPAKKVASAIKDIGCKSFFATVGMTLSVPCAK